MTGLRKCIKNKQPNKRLGNISYTLRVETAPWWQKLQYKKHLLMWFITSLLRQQCSRRWKVNRLGNNTSIIFLRTRNQGSTTRILRSVDRTVTTLPLIFFFFLLPTFAKFGFLCFMAHIVKHVFWWSWKPNNVPKTATQSVMFCIVLLIDFKWRYWLYFLFQMYFLSEKNY